MLLNTSNLPVIYAIFFVVDRLIYRKRLKLIADMLNKSVHIPYSNWKCVSCNFYYSNFMFNFIFHGDDIEIKSKKNENKNTEQYYGVKPTGVIVLLSVWQIFKQINIGNLTTTFLVLSRTSLYNIFLFNNNICIVSSNKNSFKFMKSCFTFLLTRG